MPLEPSLTLRVPARTPYHFVAVLEFLAARAIPGVESVCGHRYRRTCRLGGRAGLVEVSPRPGGAALHVRAWGVAPRHEAALRARIGRLFDTATDPGPIDSRLGRDPALGALVAAAPGLRVPGAWSGFELAVRAILGQQVSVKGAGTLAGRLAAAHGQSVPRPLRAIAAGHGLARVFPGPAALAGRDLAPIGLTRARAGTVSALARAVEDGTIDLDRGRALDAWLTDLQQVPGIGPWTAHYVAMRAGGAADAFPSSDLALRRALAPAGRPLTAPALEARAEPWRPWRAYAAMHLWRAYAEAGRSG